MLKCLTIAGILRVRLAFIPMQISSIYKRLATLIARLMSRRSWPWLIPLTFGLAIFDNLYGSATLHVAGRVLTTMAILWIPAACVVLLYEPTRRLSQSGPSPVGAALKAIVCTIVVVLSVAFLVLVHCQDWSNY